jgi:hypothetical protein
MLTPALLLAQLRSADSIFNKMGSSLRERNALESLAAVKLLLLAVGAVLVLGLLVYLLMRLRQRWHRKPLWLFLRLCRVHHVPLRDRWLLWRAARRLRLAEPALLFVDPVCLDDASALPSLFSRGDRLLELQAYLFDGADELPEDMLPVAPPSPVVPVTPPTAEVAVPAPSAVPAAEVAAAPLPVEPAPEGPKSDASSVMDDVALYGRVGRAMTSPPIDCSEASANAPSVGVS